MHMAAQCQLTALTPSESGLVYHLFLVGGFKIIDF